MNGTPLANAITADQTLVQRMADQDMPGDRVGVVAFDAAVVSTLELTPLATQEAAVISFIGGLATGGVTNIAAGINGGTARFSGPDRDEVERIMILVGDGANCCNNVAQMDANTRAAADAAAAQGIDIYTIYYAGSSNTTAAFLASLERGRGYSRQAPTGTQLTQILTDIVTGVQMRLVQ
jgi:Mg-chelatase subunit ChlD